MVVQPIRSSMACMPSAKPYTHPALVICLALFLFLTTTKGPSTSVFPSESLHNFQMMMPLRVKEFQDHEEHRTSKCRVRIMIYFHLLKQGGSTEERKEVSSGAISEWQINWQHLQQKPNNKPQQAVFVDDTS